MKPIDRFLLMLVVGATIIGAFAIRSLDQDDKRIDRGQQVANCTGRLSDDKFDWLFIAVGEVFKQIDNVAAGRDVDLSAGRRAVENGRRLSQLQRDVREHSDVLIEAGDTTSLACPELDPRLDPPAP